MYAFERSSYARERKAERARERERDASAALAEARALRSRLTSIARKDDGEDEGDDVWGCKRPHDLQDGRAAMREEMLTSLDEVEAALAEDAEARRRANASEAEKDAQVYKMQDDAEARDRDPKVKALVEEAMEALREARETPAERADDARRAVEKFAERLERALALEPEYFSVGIQLAMFYYTHGRVADGVKHMKNAYERTPACVVAYGYAGQMHEDIGLFADAEQSYVRGINTVFDHEDSWIALAKMMCATFGAVSNAISLLRAARAGGPEGKWTKPGKHPMTLFLLAYALHLNGYSAEPASLYAQSMNAGGGIMCLYPLAKVASDGGDDEAVESYAKFWRASVERAREFESSRDDDVDSERERFITSHYASLEMFNAYCIAPQWFDVLTRKARAYEAIRAFDVADEAAVPKMYTHETIDLASEDEMQTHEKCDGSKVTKSKALYILKGAHRKYAGAPKSRVVDLEGAKRALRDEAARRTRGETVAQRYVRDVITDERGKKVTIRCRAAFVPAKDASRDVAYVSNRAAACASSIKYDVDDAHVDDDAQHVTNRSALGDEIHADAREMDVADELAATLGVDVASALERQCRVVLAAFRSRVRASDNVIRDVRYDAHASIGAPVFMELEFVLARDGARGVAPAFVGVESHPRFRTPGARAFATDVWSSVFANIADVDDDDARECANALAVPPNARAFAFA